MAMFDVKDAGAIGQGRRIGTRQRRGFGIFSGSGSGCAGIGQRSALGAQAHRQRLGHVTRTVGTTISR